jgi:hypothetical protein
MSGKTPKMISYICEHIKKNWRSLPSIVDTLHLRNNLNFEAMYFKTTPTGDPVYEASKNKPKYWTMCFLTLKGDDDYSNDVYLFFSDQEDDVFKKALMNGKFLITPYTPCVFGRNKVDLKIRSISCLLKSGYENMAYVNVQWNDGKPLDFDKHDLVNFKNIIGRNITEDEVKTLTQKLLKDISADIYDDDSVIINKNINGTNIKIELKSLDNNKVDLDMIKTLKSKLQSVDNSDVKTCEDFMDHENSDILSIVNKSVSEIGLVLNEYFSETKSNSGIQYVDTDYKQKLLIPDSELFFNNSDERVQSYPKLSDRLFLDESFTGSNSEFYFGWPNGIEMNI